MADRNTQNPAAYAKHNPIDYVGKWKTPTLVIHGQQDYRVPDSQGLSVFTALQRRGIPSELLYFSQREPLGVEAGRQHSVVRHGARMAQTLERPLGS